ncbi:OsmC family protein [Kocuria sp. KH4]
MSASPAPVPRTVELLRSSTGRYTARNAAGAEVAFGQGEDLLSPVELLLAALAGCSAVPVDTATTRRAQPAQFRVEASGRQVVEDGANRLEDLRLSFHLAFPDDAAGRKAAGMVERLVHLSHDKYCTVSRTVERGTLVRHDVSVALTAEDAP